MSHDQVRPNKANEANQTLRGTRIATRMRIRFSALVPQQVPALLAKLEAHLPYSIPLLRRIQFHLHQPVSQTAKIFVAIAINDGDDDAPVETDRGGDGDGQIHDRRKSEVGNDSRVVDRWLRGSYGRGHDEKTTAAAETETEAEAEADSQPWIAAHIDLVNAGQTQVWVFASWEADGRDPFPSSMSTSASTSQSLSPSPAFSSSPSSSSSSTNSSASSPASPVHDALVRALFHYIRNDLVPSLPTSPPDEWLELQRTGKYLSTPYSRDKVLFGTVGEKLWRHFPLQARTRTDAGYWKYLFRVFEGEKSLPSSSSSSLSLSQNQHHNYDDEGGGGDRETRTPPTSSGVPSSSIPLLPPGYEFGPMRPSDLQTVLDRTPIPRTLATLRQFVSLGLFHRGEQASPGSGRGPAVGWGFLGKDASLSSLHTEPEHRGKGLAVALGRELLRRQHVVSPSDAAAEAGVEVEEGKGGEIAHGEVGHGHGNISRKPTIRSSPSTTGAKTFTWAHADVSQSNTASRRVMEKLGGVALWMVMWTEVDMEKMLSSSGSSSLAS
ncbi:uncharacterized protein Z519_05777 [Cladophialophora bantiana CBS 173.52]|uniref:N-acetyltransferase domain-containing protein n=1 Tax=Cladophialophora bantiana (strain ATCC 10958 / CBS 173.52 / CDC B-1940 / NIH 8579) TaxID=1442370 RepID=A0A0D2G3A0_CLAB1|nr:uncharacterized protein Z519_05777 [Cladophialophora bantiana CBS 173.52]KIW93172.1 hypothetical protein Z519_05777 [Cladophialophora bantiana CBS 173.52]